MTEKTERITDEKEKEKDYSRPAGFTYLKLCGSGAYGIVWLIQDISGRTLVLKQIQLTETTKRELDGLRTYCSGVVEHPNLIRICHAAETPGGFYYTMPAADNLRGNIDAYLPATLENILSRRKMTPEEIRTTALRLLDGVEYLHKQGLVHRDIKPGNVLFVNGVPCLSDIGLVGRDTSRMSMVGTLGFLPPELRIQHDRNQDKTHFKPEYDLYALGMTMYNMLSGLTASNFPVFRTTDTTPLFISLNRLILRMCDPNPAWRLSDISEIRSHLLNAGNESSLLLPNAKTKKRSIRIAAIFLSLFTIVLLFGGLFFAWKWNKTPKPAPAQEKQITVQPAPSKHEIMPKQSDTSKHEIMPKQPDTQKQGIAPELRAEWENALRTMNPERLRKCLEQGVPADTTPDGWNNTPLFSCLFRNADPAVLKLLLDAGASIHQTKPGTNNACTEAILQTASPKVLSLFFRKELDWHESTRSGRSQLFYAVGSGNSTAIRLLLDHGESVNAQDFQGQTPLYKAVQHDKTEIAELLLQSGADPTLTDKIGATPLHVVSDRSDHMVKLLIRAGAQVNALMSDGSHPLLTAIRRHAALPVIQALLDAGADPGRTDNCGLSALHEAAALNRMDILRLLLKHGAPADHPNLHGMSPLHYAAMYGRSAILRLLLQSGANANRTDYHGRTPLLYAQIHNHADCVSLLQGAGAKPEASDESGLFWRNGALTDESGRRADSLIPANFQHPFPPVPKRTFYEDCCPGELLGTLVRIGNLNEIHKFFKFEWGGASTPNFLWITPLSMALQARPLPQIIRLLLAHGANPGKSFSSASQPLALALHARLHPVIVKMLLEYGADPAEIPESLRQDLNSDFTEYGKIIHRLFDFYTKKNTKNRKKEKQETETPSLPAIRL